MLKISLEKFVELHLEYNYEEQSSFIENILTAEKNYFEILAKDTSVDNRYAMEIIASSYLKYYNNFNNLANPTQVHKNETIKYLQALWDSYDFLCKLEKAKDPNIHINNIGARP